MSVRAGENAAASPDDSRTAVTKILVQHCHECHGPDDREGGLRLLGRKDLFLLNDSGEPAIVAGRAAESELIRRVTATPESGERMPPEGAGLSAEEIETLRRWIDAGAEWDGTGEEQPRHWAYERPLRPDVPEVRREGWNRNPIDAFILSRLAADGAALEPSDPAEPGKLLRRVYLDLIGLPPTVEELNAFLADPSQTHYEQIVDRLLASPRYGEKWARQWLDLARYADSNGFQADQFREIWAWRDWVIEAFNRDMPFDEFTIAQLAGDLLPGATLADRIATGFHRCTTCNVEAGVDPEENRVNQIVDRVNTTGLVWLGTTLECAQCHNHKYDPFSQQDYYQLFAFFNNTPLEVERPGDSGVQYEVAGPKMDLPLDEIERTRRAELNDKRDDLNAKLARRKKALETEQQAWEDGLRETLANPPEWHTLDVVTFESKGGASFERLEDGSVRLTGKAPDKDEYLVTLETDLTGITGLRLECLADETLPGNGPGRGSAERPNFVLYEFEVAAGPADGTQKLKPVDLHSPVADFSQQRWDVAGLIDGDPKTGWAINPQFGKSHHASFQTDKPLGFERGTRITVRLPQGYGGARTIGRLRLSAMTGDPGADSIPQEVRDILAVVPRERTEKQQQALRKHHWQSDPAAAKLQRQIAAVDKQLSSIRPDTTLVMVELNEPRMTQIFKRGSFLTPGATVEPATPAVLHELQAELPEGEQPDRLTLARWIASPENPLIGRVTVNRWWAEFFGRGIVETLEDFGTQGERPTHPELLDWLAVEFVENGWSMKHIHRLIVTSATYQQDSRVSPEQLELDPLNRLYARGPRFRLAAESIRDNALAVSGLLSEKMGGPPVYPPQPSGIWRHVGRNAPKYNTDTDEDRYRRGIYVVWRRSAPYPSFVNFDAPDRGACVVNRSRTNTPLQALTLLNDPAYVEMAAALAVRIATAEADSPRQRIEYAYRVCMSRQPKTEEVNHLLAVFEGELQRFEKDTAAAEKVVSGNVDGSGVSRPRLAAWFTIANILLNLDETITKS
ncbi:PSD1 and planctomycete cytochrome C domain-containing protein [Maioricimonas rarisocia]|nr:PSD1 and planctomycete cytochrome C domain-containing protein [Maioricimonas rarisocia]